MDDKLRAEYDLKSLRVRRLGPGRKSFGDVVSLEPDVAKALPKKNLDLADLVSRMPADHQATEEGFGEPVGKEEW